MDLLAKRYANPFILLDTMIEQGRLFEFVREVNLIKNEEDLLHIWVHRVFDKPFNEWKESLKVAAERKTAYDAESIVKNSFDILSGFNPE